LDHFEEKFSKYTVTAFFVKKVCSGFGTIVMDPTGFGSTTLDQNPHRE
jgi:hypothetical protein